MVEYFGVPTLILIYSGINFSALPREPVFLNPSFLTDQHNEIVEDIFNDNIFFKEPWHLYVPT